MEKVQEDEPEVAIPQFIPSDLTPKQRATMMLAAMLTDKQLDYILQSMAYMVGGSVLTITLEESRFRSA
ncbi:MAG: hypothetical protein GY702_22765 [Desulfobulbaceae bacterium]|nr:hypothetical protein [Desulfobulbaceae bacterium]